MNRNGAAPIDQANELRRIVEQHKQKKRSSKSGNLRTVAILSGKGGVGKSNLAVNLAFALAEQGKKVVLLDADLGLANVDMLCGLTVKYNLTHLVNGSKKLDDVLIELTPDVWILPGGSGIQELIEMDENNLDELIDNLESLEDRADILLIDTAAGIHRNVLAFATAADTTILVTTPEPTAIRDAYTILKALKNSSQNEKRDVVSVVNMVSNEREGWEVANRLRMAANQFLNFPIGYIGYIVKDILVEQAVRTRKPFYQLYPDCPATKCVKQLVQAFGMSKDALPESSVTPKGIKSFFSRLSRGYFMER